MAIDSNMAYRSASRLAFLLTFLLIVEVVIAAVTSLLMAGQIELIDAARAGATIPQTLAEAHDARQRILGSIAMPYSVVGQILFLVWVYRVNRNAWTIDARRMNYSPGWSVGWFLVPFANLVKPYSVMREIWQVSSRGSRQNGQPAPAAPLIGTWWVVTVIHGLMHFSPWQIITGRMLLADYYENHQFMADSLWRFSWGFLIAEISGIVANVLTIVIVVRITEFQDRRQFAIAPPALRCSPDVAAHFPAALSPQNLHPLGPVMGAAITSEGPPASALTIEHL
jgi:hypothetical protein